MATGAALFMVMTSGPAAANDSTAHLAAGGLVLSRNDAIEMRSEDLFISMDEVRVRYRFHNRTGKDVTTLVAFPLPDITAPSDENNFVHSGPQRRHQLPRLPHHGRRRAGHDAGRAARLRGRRRPHRLLKRLGLPIAPHNAALGKMIVKLPAAAQQELRELGMIKYEEYRHRQRRDAARRAAAVVGAHDLLLEADLPRASGRRH